MADFIVNLEIHVTHQDAEAEFIVNVEESNP